MSSNNASSAVTYMFISSYSNGPSWGIPLMNAGELPEMDPYKEVAQQGQAATLSPTYVPDPMELEHHIPVYIPKPVYPEYHVSEKDPEEDSEEDPIDYAADTDDNKEDEDEEESSDDDKEEEEHLHPIVALSAVDHCTTSKMSVQTQTPIPFPSEKKVARIFALPTPPPSPLTSLSLPLPQIPSPPTHHPLPLPAPSTSHKADIPEAELPPQKRLLLTALTPRFEIGESSTADAAARQPRSTVARRVDYSFVDTLDAIIRRYIKEVPFLPVVGIKRILDDLKVTTAQVCVTVAKLNAANGISTANFEYYYCQGKWNELVLLALKAVRLILLGLIIYTAGYVRIRSIEVESNKRYPTTGTTRIVGIKRLLDDLRVTAAQKVIENGNIAPKTIVVEGVEKVMPPTTAEEKAQKRLEVKARSTLMMGIPDEH
ncbi:hypothetical protein Tco_0178666 [Tanacetum coccineum]